MNLKKKRKKKKEKTWTYFRFFADRLIWDQLETPSRGERIKLAVRRKPRLPLQ